MNRKFLVLILVLAPVLAAVPAQAKWGNLRINPLAFLGGTVHADLTFEFANGVMFGPAVGYFSFANDNAQASGSVYGARANLFFNGNAFSDGFYLGPFGYVGQMSAKEKSSNLPTPERKGEFSVTSYGGVLGYQWMWTTLNIGLGAGLISFQGPATVKLTNGGVNPDLERDTPLNKGGLFLEFALGFAF